MTNQDKEISEVVRAALDEITYAAQAYCQDNDYIAMYLHDKEEGLLFYHNSDRLSVTTDEDVDLNYLVGMLACLWDGPQELTFQSRHGQEKRIMI